MSMNYSPKSAAACVTSQGKSVSPHGSGTFPSVPKGDRDGQGMGYKPAKAVSCLNGQGGEKSAPGNAGPTKSY